MYLKLVFFLGLFTFSTALQAQSKFPLKEYPVANSQDDYFILMLSGDGGWYKREKKFAKYYHKKGIPVVGLNSNAYFKHRKAKETVIADLKEIIDQYSKKWGKSKVLLVGYSFGADVLPHAVNNMGKNYQEKLKGLVLLVPSKYVLYKVTLWSMLNLVCSGELVLPELEQMNKTVPLFLACNETDEFICDALPKDTYPQMRVEGGHTLKNKMNSICKEVSKQFGLEE